MKQPTTILKGPSTEVPLLWRAYTSTDTIGKLLLCEWLTLWTHFRLDSELDIYFQVQFPKNVTFFF